MEALRVPVDTASTGGKLAMLAGAILLLLTGIGPLISWRRMSRGAFRSLEHDHRFDAIDASHTRMTDVVHFAAPLGPHAKGYLRRGVRGLWTYRGGRQFDYQHFRHRDVQLCRQQPGHRHSHRPGPQHCDGDHQRHATSVDGVDVDTAIATSGPGSDWWSTQRRHRYWYGADYSRRRSDANECEG